MGGFLFTILLMASGVDGFRGLGCRMFEVLEVEVFFPEFWGSVLWNMESLGS